MKIEQQLQDKIDAFLNGKLDDVSRLEFEREIANDDSIVEKIKATQLEQAILKVASEQDLRRKMENWDTEIASKRASRKITRKWLLRLGLIALISSGIFFYFLRSSKMLEDLPSSPFPLEEEELFAPNPIEGNKTSNRDKVPSLRLPPSSAPQASLQKDSTYKNSSLAALMEEQVYLAKSLSRQLDGIKGKPSEPEDLPPTFVE